MENIFENIFSLPTATTNNNNVINTNTTTTTTTGTSTNTTTTSTHDDMSWLLGTSTSILQPYNNNNNSNNNFDTSSISHPQQTQQPTTPYFYIPTPNNLNNTSDNFNFNNYNFNNFNFFPNPTIPQTPINESEDPQIKEQLLIIQQQKQHTNEQIQQTLQNYHHQQQQTYENRQQQFDQQQHIPPLESSPSLESSSSPSPPITTTTTTTTNSNNNNNVIFDIDYNYQPQFFNPITVQTQTQQQPIQTPTINTTTTTNITNKNTTTKTTKSRANKKTTTTTTKLNKNESGDESIDEDELNSIDEDEKKKSINRVYHKKHREKKKDYIKLMENQMASLSFQNQQLRKENENLKKNGEGVDSLKPDKIYFKFYNDLVDITRKLKLALEVKDERSLIYILHFYHKVFADLYNLCKRDVDLVLHPNMQLLLASMSYIPHCDPIVFDIIAGPGSDIWINQFKEEANLTPYQSTKFEELRIKFAELDQKCLKDRLELDSEVKKFFNTNMLLLPKHYNPFNIMFDGSSYISDISQSSLINSQPLDLCQMLEFVCKLDALKSKVYLGRILILDIYAMVSSLLTPTQEAMFHVRINEQISFDFSNLGLINHVWTSLMPSKSVLDISEGLEKIAPTPFYLKPATFNIKK